MKSDNINTMTVLTTAKLVNHLNDLALKYEFDIISPDDSWANLTQFITHHDNEHVFAYAEDPIMFNPEQFVSEDFTGSLPVIFIGCKSELPITRWGEKGYPTEDVALLKDGTLQDVSNYPVDDEVCAYRIPHGGLEVIRIIKGFMLMIPHGLFPESLENEFRRINCTSESMDQVIEGLALLKSIHKD